MLVSQFDNDFDQVKELIKETKSSVNHVAIRLEALSNLLDNLKNKIGNTKDTTQRSWKEGGILKRVREERDDETRVGCDTRREGKRARVAWQDE